MARKKSTKSTPKKKITRKATAPRKKTSALTNLKAIEKEMISTPSKISAQLIKLISAQKKKQLKLKKALAKAKQAIDKSEATIELINNQKTTPASKKRLKLITQKYSTQMKQHHQLHTAAEQLTTSITELTEQQEKFDALANHILDFHKNWSKTAKKNVSHSEKTTRTLKPKSNTHFAPDHQHTSQSYHSHDDLLTLENESNETTEFTS